MSHDFTLTAPPSVREPLSSSLFVVVPHQVTQYLMLIGQKMRGALSPKKKSYIQNIYFGLQNVRGRWMCPLTAEYFEKMAGIMNFTYF